jgi:hypothetical protein
MIISYSTRHQEITMKIVLRILGVLFILIGLVWILQGINVLPGSMMSGQIQYAVLGLVAAALGGLMLFFANRKTRPTGG